jgi:xanthine dehydrogenase accessory factor
VVEGPGAGEKHLVEEGDTSSELAAQADEVIRGARNQLLEVGDRKIFAEVYMPPPRLFVYGAVDTAEALCRGAKLLGWSTIVADARRAFATTERFPSADELIVEWPEEAIARVAPDHQTAFVVLTHDAKFDQPALQAILATEAFYVGALGSRRNQEKRRARLLEAGVPEEALGRIAGPCGLDIGAESQEETALSILGEILAVRAGRPGGRLQEAKRRIHAQEDAPAPSPAA